MRTVPPGDAAAGCAVGQVAEQAGLVLLSVNIDEKVAPAMEMAQTLKVSYIILSDARKEVSRAYET